MPYMSRILDRRTFFGTVSAAAAHAAAAPLQAAPQLADDGNYTQDWYVHSFLDLKDDLARATENGRHLALQWGQAGCSSCIKLHTVYFASPALEGFVRSHFDIVHLVIYGAREVTGFDGVRRNEKAFAAYSGVRVTPTFQFFAQDGATAREVARMPGLFAPAEFMAMFRYVASRGYRDAPFLEWLARQKAQNGSAI